MIAAEPLCLRVQLTRQDKMRFLSHTEYWRTVMMAARRSGLPLAYTAGYRSRIRISLSPPLPIGVTSDCELMDLFLDRYVPAAEAERLLSGSMPGGMEVAACRLMGPDAKGVGKLIDTAAYRAFLPGDAGEEADWSRAVEEFLSCEVVTFERVQPRRTRVVNLRAGLHALEVRRPAGGEAPEVYMVVDDGTRGTIKPREVLKALAERAGAPPGVAERAGINREGLFSRRGERLVSPMEQVKRRPAARGRGERWH